MDTKTEIKEEDAFSDNVVPENEREIFTKVVTIKTNSDPVLLKNDCNIVIKTEFESETPILDCCSLKERECFTKHVNYSEFEIVQSSNNCEINIKPEIEEQTLISGFGSEYESKFLTEDAVVKDEKYNSSHEMDNLIQIKEEPWLLETDTSSVCHGDKAGSFPLVKSSRLSTKAVSDSGNSTFLSAEVSGSDTSFQKRKDCHEYESKLVDVSEIPTVEEHPHSGQFDKYSNGREIYSLISNSKQNNLIHKAKRLHKCAICEKTFTRFSGLKMHNLIHEGKRPYHCKICNKSSTRLSDLKTHNLIHEGKKSHQCAICYKSFTRLSYLKIHNLIHNGKKPHQCEVCGKSFARPSDLKIHNLIHLSKKPHQCNTCDKSFSKLSHLKIHDMIHEGKKPHQCKTCDKKFTRLWDLKTHSLIHEGTKSHQCKTCEKKFTRLSSLKTHNLIHEGKKPHQCKTCKKKFTQLSHLKGHYFIHKNIKPFQ